MGGDLEDILMLFTVVLLLPGGPLAGNMQLPGSSKKILKNDIISVTIVYHTDIKVSDLIRINTCHRIVTLADGHVFRCCVVFSKKRSLIRNCSFCRVIC